MISIILSSFVQAEMIFQRYNLISPLGLASGGVVSGIYNDSYNIYNNPSYLGISDYSYYGFNFFKDSFDNYLFHISAVKDSQKSPYNIGCQIFYNDFSDDDIDYKTYGVNPGLSIKIFRKFYAGLSCVLYKTAFEDMDNLSLLGSTSFTYSIINQGYLSVYLKNLGKDITAFGNYKDSFYPDTGIIYHQRLKWNLITQGVFNYSLSEEWESSILFGYDFKYKKIGLLPIISLSYADDFNFVNSLGYGLQIKIVRFVTEFGFKVINSENLFSLSIKNISY